MNYKSNKKQVLTALSQAERRTLEGIGVFVHGQAVMRCPVGASTSRDGRYKSTYSAPPGYVGGNLRSSLNHSVDEKNKAVIVGTPVEYAPYVELSTSRTPAQPFLEPAVMDNVGRIRDLVSKLFKL